MRFLMKQKFWSLGEDFTIRDESGADCYQVDGRVFSLGDKLSLQDMSGNELAFISQRLLSWGKTYEIHRPGLPVSVVKEKLLTLFRCKFSVDGPDDEDYDAQGDFLDHEYVIEGADRTAAIVSKRWFSWTDTYGVEIAPGADPILMLATAVVIDLVCHDESESGH